MEVIYRAIAPYRAAKLDVYDTAILRARRQLYYPFSGERPALPYVIRKVFASRLIAPSARRRNGAGIIGERKLRASPEYQRRDAGMLAKRP